MSQQSSSDEVWERRWQDGRIGFDQHAAHPSLVDLLLGPKADELGISKAGRAVVPGCGRVGRDASPSSTPRLTAASALVQSFDLPSRDVLIFQGYDVDLLARRGLDAVGVDISPKGVEEAQKWLSAQDTDQSDGRREVLAADFFDWAKGVVGRWDVLLDYTFLCALPPDLRNTYISSLSTLARPASSTRLITLMYPLLPPPHDLTQGPPFALSVDEYHRLLDQNWVLIWSEPVPNDKMRKTGASGGEMVGVWAWRS